MGDRSEKQEDPRNSGVVSDILLLKFGRYQALMIREENRLQNIRDIVLSWKFNINTY